jgi:tRNA nucleotidyltransferase (CCA-adding enzyme)
LEDALRRDFTINALFYNINTEEIEDFTKQGVSDIENKVIRTPLRTSINEI